MGQISKYTNRIIRNEGKSGGWWKYPAEVMDKNARLVLITKSFFHEAEVRRYL